jgi:hypothetical protein
MFYFELPERCVYGCKSDHERLNAQGAHLNQSKRLRQMNDKLEAPDLGPLLKFQL